MAEIIFRATPNQEKYINSRKFLVVCMGPRGEGKFLVPDALVLTPTGWVKAGDINEGDEVIAGDGTSTRIVGVYPQSAQPLWRLHFSDGTSVVTSDDHLWQVTTEHYRNGFGKPRSGRGGKPYRPHQIVTTQQVRQRLERTKRSRWSIPLLSAPAQFPPRLVPLDPYLLGVLLGDGCLTPPSVRLITADQEIVERVQAVVPTGIRVCHQERYAYILKQTSRTTNPVMAAVRHLGLVRCRAWEKFVPPIYLWNSADVRSAVLQGLLDTDGHPSNGQVLFTTTSSRLADDVVFLAQSLGGTATTTLRESAPGSQRPSYRVTLRLPETTKPFRLTRKVAIVERHQSTRNRPRRLIVGVESAGEGGGVCFKIAHASGLFVIHDFIVTHNTVASVFAVLAHAMRHSADHWPVRWAVIRDTLENLKLTTIASIRLCIRKYRIPAEGHELIEPRVIRLGMRTANGTFKPIVELNFFGLDQPADANRLQGFEGGGAWIEEPAPAADLSSGVPEDALLAVTSLRQEGIEPRVQISTNPPDQTHWMMKYKTDPDVLADLEAKGITVDFIEIPKGENPGVTPEYRARNRAILERMGRYDLIARLVEGQVGYIQLGVAVTPEFGAAHVATVSLPIFRSAPITRGWDGGLHPTTVWMQCLPPPNNFIHVLFSIRGEHIGMEQHIEQNVRPWQQAMGLRDYTFEDIGDPSMADPEKKNSSVSSVTAIEEMLTGRPRQPAVFTPGPIPIDDRVLPLRAILRGPTIRGMTRFRLDPAATDLRRALEGGWHRKKHPSGIIGEILKDGNSEHGDALAYPLGEKFPLERLVERPRVRRPLPRQPVVGAGQRQAWMTT